MSGSGLTLDALVARLEEKQFSAGDLTGEDNAGLAADLLIAISSGRQKLSLHGRKHLLDVIEKVDSEKLRIVTSGLLWREDLAWLDEKLESGDCPRELLLNTVAKRMPKLLSPVFWNAVSERGPRYTSIAFEASSDSHPEAAARLLVRLCRLSVQGQIFMDIKSKVNGFLNARDASVRTAFISDVKRLPDLEKRKLMAHLDLSLLAELDESVIEHKGKDFFYDAEAEREKREAKSKDIFAEVKKRLERGDKPL